MLLAAYLTWTLAFVLQRGFLVAAPFVALFLAGYLWVGIASLSAPRTS